MDPVTTLTTISLGLKVIEQFRKIALRAMGRQGSEPSVTVETKPDKNIPGKGEEKGTIELEVLRNGAPVAMIRPRDLKMGAWDQQRYETLESVIQTLFTQFNGLEAELAVASPLERIKMQQQMERIKKDLCPKFREMLNLYQKTLGVSLEDHFALQSVCGGN
jgi:hypothetical protein